MKRVKTNDPNSVDIFINALKNNQIIAYPTDTIYGLGTDINNNKGIDRINSIKMRKQPMSVALGNFEICLLYTSPSPRDYVISRMPSSA